MDLYCDYDENLSQNAFFRKLQSEHKIIIDTAPLENWIICIPRAATITQHNLSEPDFLLAHVLIPSEELPQTHFNSLLGIEIRLENKKLHLTTQQQQQDTPTISHGQNAEPVRATIESLVLFEEFFYTKQLMKYKVWCIEAPLFDDPTETNRSTTNPPGIYVVRDPKDAVEIIWNETHSNAILRKIDAACTSFAQKKHDVTRSTESSLANLRDAFKALYGQCIQILMANKALKEKCRIDGHFYKIIRIALETHMMNVAYSSVFDQIVLATREAGEEFNRVVRSLADSNVTFFGISPKHIDAVACVRTELLKIEECGTAVEKLGCIRRSINATSRNGRRTLGMDDLIPIVAFVLIKSGLTHWTATLIYLQQFVFNDLTDVSEKGADSFLVTTIEAAMSYITGLAEKRRPTLAKEDTTTDKTNHPTRFDNVEEFIEHFFELVRLGDEPEVLRLFRKKGKTANGASRLDAALNNNNPEGTDRDEVYTIEEKTDCHPLCDCSECALIINGNRIDVNVQNIHGINAIHVAAMFGLTKMINVLLTLDTDLTLNDENGWTALHYSASLGHQSAVLLLLHAGIEINAKSNDLFTALHLACLNGHDGCVKAILYYAEQVHENVDKNGINRTGDTALHLAARWGFSQIVDTLLEYGVHVEIPNRWGLTASDCAHNSLIRDQLQNMFVVVDQPSNEDGWDTVNGGDHEKREPFRGCISEQILSKQINRRSSNNDKVIAAIRNGDTKLAYYFLGWDEDTSDSSTSTTGSTEICHPLCTCSRCADIKSQQSTSDCAKVVDVNATNPDGITMLHAAAQTGNLELVQFLLGQGALVGKRTPIRQTALHLAVLSKDWSTVSLILQNVNEFELNVQDGDGNTALHLAVLSGSSSLVELMLRHEPWLGAMNEDKQTAADLARKSYLFNVANMLELASAALDIEDSRV